MVAHVVTKRRKKARQRDREAWKQTLLGVVVDEAPPDALADLVGGSRRRQFLSFLVPYATTVRGEARAKIREVARPFLPVAERNLNARSQLVRAQAARQIGLFGKQEQASLLRESLDDSSDRVVSIAFRYLAAWGDPADAPRLLKATRRLSRADRHQLVSSLVELGEEAAPFFREELRREDRLFFQRVVCAETLRWLGDAGAASTAADLLRQPVENPELTASLLRLIRRVGGPQHAAAVRAHCEHEVSYIRIQATRALGQIGEESDGPFLAHRVRNDPSRWVALSAAQSLAELGRTDQLKTLLDENGERASIAADLLPDAS